MTWWLWLLFGLLLVGAELVTPGGFYVIFFGVAALVLGGLVGLGAGGPVWFQWLLFSVLSVVSLVVFRNPLLRRLRVHGAGPAIDDLVGELATPTEDIEPGAVGRAELRGATWNARNAGQTGLSPGRRCRVERVEGLLLWIRPE